MSAFPAEDEWYAGNECSHAHCPRECEKPQPLMHGVLLVCGKCLVLDGVISLMVPCSPVTCRD